MGWFFGFKLHLVFNNDNEIVALKLTPGNVHDTTPVPALTRDLIGKLFGDKGSISWPKTCCACNCSTHPHDRKHLIQNSFPKRHAAVQRQYLDRGSSWHKY